MLADFTDEEIKQPSPRKQIDGSRTIYQSRKFRRPFGGRGYGLFALCDFGEAKIGKAHESGPFVQPHIYRAPEIIFEVCETSNFSNKLDKVRKSSPVQEF